MAEGTNYAKFAAPVLATLMGAEWKGKVRAIIDNYTFASAAIGTVVNVGILRKDEVFITGWVTGADLGSATTLQLGDDDLDGSSATDDDDRYLAATVFTTANQQTQCNALAGRGYKATKDMIIKLKTGAEEATGRVDVILLIACPN